MGEWGGSQTTTDATQPGSLPPPRSLFRSTWFGSTRKAASSSLLRFVSFPTMTLDQLRVLVKVVDAGSFTAAADVLGVQRSHVSRVIAQLEAELGVTLLERTTRRQSPPSPSSQAEPSAGALV